MMNLTATEDLIRRPLLLQLQHRIQMVVKLPEFIDQVFKPVECLESVPSLLGAHAREPVALVELQSKLVGLTAELESILQNTEQLGVMAIHQRLHQLLPVHGAIASHNRKRLKRSLVLIM